MLVMLCEAGWSYYISLRIKWCSGTSSEWGSRGKGAWQWSVGESGGYHWAETSQVSSADFHHHSAASEVVTEGW